MQDVAVRGLELPEVAKQRHGSAVPGQDIPTLPGPLGGSGQALHQAAERVWHRLAQERLATARGGTRA
jgi:hypothetical protein